MLPIATIREISTSDGSSPVKLHRFCVALEGEAAYIAAQCHTPEDMATLTSALSSPDGIVDREQIGVEADFQFMQLARTIRNSFFY